MCAHAETKRNGVSYSSRGRPVLPQEFIFHTRIHRARGPVDQLEDRYLGMVEAVGSNPTRSTFRRGEVIGTRGHVFVEVDQEAVRGETVANLASSPHQIGGCRLARWTSIACNSNL